MRRYRKKPYWIAKGFCLCIRRVISARLLQQREAYLADLEIGSSDMFLYDYFGSESTVNGHEQGLESADTEVDIQGEDWGLMYHTFLANRYGTMLYVTKTVNDLLQFWALPFYFMST